MSSVDNTIKYSFSFFLHFRAEFLYLFAELIILEKTSNVPFKIFNIYYISVKFRICILLEKVVLCQWNPFYRAI